MSEKLSDTRVDDLTGAIALLEKASPDGDVDETVEHITDVLDQNQDLLTKIEHSDSNLQTELFRRNVRKALVARNAIRVAGDVSGARGLISEELEKGEKTYNI